MPNLGSQTANRLEKTRKLTRAAETMLARLGVTDFAAEGLADLIGEWGADVWNVLSVVARVTVCSGAARNERVCAACRALVVADFRARPDTKASLSRVVGEA